MKYFLRIIVSFFLLILSVIIPVMGNRWIIDRKSVPNVSTSELVKAFPEKLGESKGETFHNSDNTLIYRSYEKRGSIAVRVFGSEQEARQNLIITSTDKQGNVQSRINGSIVSQGKVRTIRKTALEGFYTTSDTNRIGFYWLNGKVIYSIEASNKRYLENLAGQYPYFKLKFDLFRILVTAARSIGLWVLPLLVFLSIVIYTALILSGLAGLYSLTGSRKGENVVSSSESELSAELEALNSQEQLRITEGGRYDYRIDKVVKETDMTKYPVITHSALLTLDPLKKTVYAREFRVSVTAGQKENQYRRRLSFLPVLPESIKSKDAAGNSIASILVPVVTKSGWKWRPETEIPTTRAILKRMEKSAKG